MKKFIKKLFSSLVFIGFLLPPKGKTYSELYRYKETYLTKIEKTTKPRLIILEHAKDLFENVKNRIYAAHRSHSSHRSHRSHSSHRSHRSSSEFIETPSTEKEVPVIEEKKIEKLEEQEHISEPKSNSLEKNRNTPKDSFQEETFKGQGFYELHLKDGRILKVKSYWKEGDQIKYVPINIDAIIGISTNEVEEIKESQYGKNEPTKPER